jgi:hypothetical protein
MIEHPELSPIESLVLVRLLLDGDKGATTDKIQKDLASLLSHRWTGTALTAVLDRAVLKLASLGLVAEKPVPPPKGKGKKAKPAPTVLTEAGRKEALAVLRVGQLPAKPKPTWANLKKSLLLAPALGLKGASTSLGTEDNFRALLLKTLYDLPLGEYPKPAEVKAEWTRKALGMGQREKVSLANVQAALFRRELGDDGAVPMKNPLDHLLARRLSARRADPKELRDEILRRWVEAGLGKTPAASPPALAPDAAPLDLADFARRVQSAARACPTGRYGDNKVFIAHVWKALEGEPEFRGMDLDGFKHRLAEANNARLLDLSRADLVQAMDPDDVQSSEVEYLNATFHFIRIEPERH